MSGVKTVNVDPLAPGRHYQESAAAAPAATDPAPARFTSREHLIRQAAPRALEGVKGQDELLRRALANGASAHVNGNGEAPPVGEAAAAGQPVDLVVAFEDEPHAPDDVFRRLRWGGQFLYVSRRRGDVAGLPERFNERGFLTARPPSFVRTDRFGFRMPVPLPLPLLTRKVHYFTSRKVELVPPREFSDRFTYRVQLVPHARAPLGYVVQKEVPSFERVVARLRHKFPDAPQEVVEKRARKFTDKIFPVFLTREAAMLRILERDLPGPFRRRVPHVIDLEQDERGYVRRLRMNWLRNGGRPISQLEFAQQSAELLEALHDRANVIHLDLRLDNFVVTEHGVGFVDFGSAVRVGENLHANPMLETIFQELMKTSQIQRMLEHMTLSGEVTSRVLTGAQGQVDKAVDLFYLAVQINDPLQNPEFRGLIEFDPASEQAAALAKLTEDVLKPKDPQNPTIRTARELLEGILWTERLTRRG